MTQEHLWGLTCTCGPCPIHRREVSVVGQEASAYAAVLGGLLRIDELGRIWRGDNRAEHVKDNKYLRITFRMKGKIVNTGAHRLVWYHFHGPIPPGLQVNHLDGDGFNNSPENLQLVTPRENSLHRYHKLGRHNLTSSGRAKGRSRGYASAQWRKTASNM